MTAKTGDHDRDRFDQEWLDLVENLDFVEVIYSLIGLTRLGARPTRLSRLATVLGRTEPESAALARQHAHARIEGDLVHLDTPFPGGWSRRKLYVGGREISVSGCAPDLFGVAAVLDVPFHVEDACATTGAPIRVDFAPGGGVDRVEPSETVVAMLAPSELAAYADAGVEEINAKLCSQQPFYASPDAARQWLDQHLGGRVFTVAEMVERPFATSLAKTLQRIAHAT